MSEKNVPFKQWQSPLSLDEVFAQSGTPSYLELKDGCLYWMEQNPELSGATQIKCRQANGEVHTLTSAKLNARTRSNEYGGKAYCVGDDALYFCNDRDQRIYRLALNHDFYGDFGDEPFVTDDSFEESFGDLLDENAPVDQAQPITPDNGCMYADLCLSKDGKWLFFIMETPKSSENRTEIAMLSTQLGVDEPIVLASGCDFYASLVLTEESDQIAWVEWRHPNMPWDETHVVIGNLSYGLGDPLNTPRLESLSNQLDATISALGQGATISHLSYETFNTNDSDNQSDSIYEQSEDSSISEDNSVSEEVSDNDQVNRQRLFMAIDWPEQESSTTRNFAQLYCWDGKTLFEITQGRNEYSYPHWVYGNRRYVFVGDQKILAIATNQWGDELHLIDLVEENITRLAESFVHFSGICAENGVAYVVAESEVSGSQVLRINDKQVAASPQKQVLTAPNVSCAEPITVLPPEDSSYGNSHAFFYAPKNIQYSMANSEALPPLIVMVHGGPTSRAQNHFDVQKQFWTTSGFAVLDVNHRGSSGFGRYYRDQLLGEWGVADAHDIKAAIEDVLEKGLVHPDQVFIRGKSAGGYAVLRALTLYPDLFAAGASYYGIGDLGTLASVTHKFESRYCDQLLGEVFDKDNAKKPESAYYQRSPIHEMKNIKCPMVLFQGLDDKVVPPELAQQVAQELANNFLEYEYHTYPGEGHGFRGMTAQIDSLTKELQFYRKQMQD